MLKRILLWSASFSLLASPSFAQQAQEPDQAESEEIVVTGTALSRQNAIDEKRTDIRIIEALGVDELGQMPDRNIGETLNRLPGVSMLVEKGEGHYVQIRGVNSSLNNVTINGVQLGSPESEFGGRSAPLEMISSSVLGGVQVVKSPTPDMDAQGIGGTVNVETRMPFDRSEQFYGAVTARLGYEDTRPEPQAYGGYDPYGIDAMLSGKTADDRLGWLIGASYLTREYIATGIYQDDWIMRGDAALPANVKNNYYVIGRERFNLNAALEFRPDANSSYFVRGFFAQWNELQHRNRFEQNLSAGIVATSADEGVSGRNRVLANLRSERTDKSVASLAVGGENAFDRFELDYLVQANQNEIAEPFDYWEFRSGAIFGPNTWSVDGDGIVTITPDAGTPDRQDPNLIGFRRVRFFDDSVTEDTLVGQVNLRWNMRDDVWLKFGLKGAETERTLDLTQRQYNAGAPSFTLGTSPSFTNGAFINDTPAGPAPNIWMDLDGLNAFFRDPANASRFVLDAAGNFDFEYFADYDITETVLAAYGMGVAQVGSAEIIAGVRVESTEVDSIGYLRDNGVATRIHAGNDYVDWLPALIVNWRPTDALVVRGAITRALGRPEYDDIAPNSRYDDSAGAIATLSIGNPDLRARTSWNYDASIEWYPNRLTLVSASLFYKDISDELIGVTTSFSDQAAMQEALRSRGLTTIDTSSISRLDLSTTINGSSSTLRGIELSAQTQFDMLPGWLSGLGFYASATFIDGETRLASGDIPLIGQPEQTLAFSLFYQKGPIDASVNYSYNSSYLTDLNNDPFLNLDQGEFGRWDAKATYTVNDSLRLFIEGVNLNDEPTSEFQGGVERRNTEFEYVGRSFFLGATYAF